MSELTDVDIEGEDMTLGDDDDNTLASMRNHTTSSTEPKLADKVVIICQPNAALYELSCYDDQKINFYLKKGISIVFWNYRGFGRSFGSPTLSNMAQDG